MRVLYRKARLAGVISGPLLFLFAALPLPAHADHGPTLTVTADTVLTGDFAGHVVIGADGVTLDCNSFSLIGPAAVSAGSGILLDGRTGVTVKNCDVTGFAFGIHLLSSSGNTLTGNTANANLASGFHVVFSSGNALSGNTANNNMFGGFAAFGFRLYVSAGNTLTANTANNNFAFGVSLENSPGTTLIGNTANNNIDGFQIGSSADNTLTGNTANNNASAGFNFFASSGNVVMGNTAIGNSRGLNLFGDASSTAVDNSVTHNLIESNEVGIGICQSLLGKNAMAPNTFRHNGVALRVSPSC